MLFLSAGASEYFRGAMELIVSEDEVCLRGSAEDLPMAMPKMSEASDS